MAKMFTEKKKIGFREAQKIANEAVTHVAKVLEVGMSEKEVASLIETYCRDVGVKSFFHTPFAWFAERSKYQNFKTPFDFLPSERKLKTGDVVILDVAPIVNGFVADVGYTFIFNEKPNEELQRARDLLVHFRKKLPEYFMSELSTSQIWHKVEEEMNELRFENVYQKYPFSVLGHKVHEVPFGNISGLTSPFGLHSFFSILSRGIFPELLGPKHKGSKIGIWAIEPHLGGEKFGAKFEELLVVEENEKGKVLAYWIDEDVPHMKAGWPCL